VQASTDDLKLRTATATGTTAATLVLAGAPLQRFGRRLGLIGGDSNSVPLGLVLGGSLWLVLLLFSWIDGVHDSLFSLSAIGVHVRLLVALPLLFVAETLVAPCVATFIETVVRSEVVPPRAQPALRADLASTRRLASSWWPELLCLLGALAMLLAGSHLHLHGSSATLGAADASVSGTLAGLWYGIICLTVVRFALLRWLWRMLLWCRFLWRLSRLDLHLVPTIRIDRPAWATCRSCTPSSCRSSPRSRRSRPRAWPRRSHGARHRWRPSARQSSCSLRSWQASSSVRS